MMISRLRGSRKETGRERVNDLTDKVRQPARPLKIAFY